MGHILWYFPFNIRQSLPNIQLDPFPLRLFDKGIKALLFDLYELKSACLLRDYLVKSPNSFFHLSMLGLKFVEQTHRGVNYRLHFTFEIFEIFWWDKGRKTAFEFFELKESNRVFLQTLNQLFCTFLLLFQLDLINSYILCHLLKLRFKIFDPLILCIEFVLTPIVQLFERRDLFHTFLATPLNVLFMLLRLKFQTLHLNDRIVNSQLFSLAPHDLL